MSPSTGSGDAVLAELRGAVVAGGRRLGARGLIAAGEGNLSVRLDGGRLLITPAGVRKDELEPGDLTIVPLEPAAASSPGASSPGEARASSDVAIHRAVLRARPDVTAVAHAHLPAAMALTLAGVEPDPGTLPETAALLPRLPFVPFGAPGSEELAGRVAAALADGPEPLPSAVLLERHGALAVGTGPGAAAVRQAVDRLELVEVLCRTWLDALLIEASLGRAAESGRGLSFRHRTGRSDGRGTRSPGRDR